MKINDNIFGKYSSKVKRVNIPIPSFEYVHKSWFSDRLGSPTPGFMIGRDRIIEKLKTWLIKEKTSGGSYLITGYRGMGKTSFVDRVLYELVGEPNVWLNLGGVGLFVGIAVCLFMWISGIKENNTGYIIFIGLFGLVLHALCKYYYLKEIFVKIKYRIQAGIKCIVVDKNITLWKMMKVMKEMWCGLTSKEWDRISHLIYGANEKDKRYSHISVNVNLGQEILDERNILCVLTSELYNKYKQYILSPIANVEMWALCIGVIVIPVAVIARLAGYDSREDITWSNLITTQNIFILVASLVVFFAVSYHQLSTLCSLKILRKRIDAELKSSQGIGIRYKKATLEGNMEFAYPIANIRDIESRIITILDQIYRYPMHPTFYFVFDELDKIETPLRKLDDGMPEFSNEKYLSSGGTSRKRKFMVMHLLANMKYFTTTAKAKFLFIAGREMYDGYLADLTDRESAISSLFNGIVYVESFCKNEKSEKDVMYNAETFIARQIIPRWYIEDRIRNRYIECKLNGKEYTNMDIDLKLYYEFLITVYTKNIMKQEIPHDKKNLLLKEARAGIDKAVGLLYHFTVYLYHVSNGSPKKMRLTFENLVRPIRDPKEFRLTKRWSKHYPLGGADLDIYIPDRCKYLLSLGEKEQRVIGFIHYISFPVNQIITDANQFGDKLLVAASFLINHLYKYHSGGFSWRNIEQTPELLEVYKIPEFRGFINSILSYLMQTHIIQIPCGLFQFKFRKQISEEISLASKVSEEISAIFNFTLDESQAVKRHYLEMISKYQQLHADHQIVSPHAEAGIHHILADLYMADEEYNLAIFEYQTALKVLSQENTDNDDSHKATFTLAYIRCMLKLGMVFEKRKTFSSAYNIYNEIIDRIIRFREFNEKDFGLIYKEKPKERWPYTESILYCSNQHSFDGARKIFPTYCCSRKFRNLQYRTKGKYMISDFAFQMTSDKHTVIQRLAMLEDTPIVYQALLAKLFINEKIELGGITRSNLDVIEGEYQYISLTTNEKEKFLISTDFFRRLGDILFYKNGLIGFSYERTKDTKENDWDTELRETFVDSLYYWAFNLKTELQSFCGKNKCYEYFPKLYKYCRELNYNQFQDRLNNEQFTNELFSTTEENNNQIQKLFKAFRKEEPRRTRLRKLPIKDITLCNEKRKKMWVKNRTLPCYACKYYNRSLRITMHNLFGVDTECIKKDNTKESKTINVLRQIVLGGSAKSMRQNYMIQLAEVLDCLGNTTLSCSILENDEISSEFLSKFLHDVHEVNNKLDKQKDENDFMLLRYPIEKYNRLETCILYFWEASVCFRYGKELKKASDSMKKVLRVIQNYLRVEEQDENHDRSVKSKTVIGEFLNEIKNRIVKQSLLCLFSHYNYINVVEIQRLKWIFYTQMYENISMTRLTLFPDVEEIMLIYYELFKLCMIDEKNYDYANEQLKVAREYIVAYSRDHYDEKKYTWNNIEERNRDFNERLIGIYNNISMSSLRHENTRYERILSLRMKALLNMHILGLMIPKLKDSQKLVNNNPELFKIFENELTDKFADSKQKDETWKDFFPDVIFCSEEDPVFCRISDKLHTLEFLIKDSMYCVTEILETLSPYTSTTLFTHSFIGNIYHSLNKWNYLFNALFHYYKFFDLANPIPVLREDNNVELEQYFARYDYEMMEVCQLCGRNCEKYLNQKVADNYGTGKKLTLEWQSECPKYRVECDVKGNGFDKDKRFLYAMFAQDDIERLSAIYRKVWQCHNISDRFFKNMLNTITKPNIQYTLTNYSGELAIKSYRDAIAVHREGRAYKEMISRMFYLDDDLKNDTIQFDLAIERFKINSDYIDKNIGQVMDTLSDSLYNIENFCMDNETRVPLEKRFPNLFWNVYDDEKQ